MVDLSCFYYTTHTFNAFYGSCYSHVVRLGDAPPWMVGKGRSYYSLLGQRTVLTGDFEDEGR